MDTSRNSGILLDPSGFDGFIKGTDDFVAVEFKIQINGFAFGNLNFFSSTLHQKMPSADFVFAGGMLSIL